MNYTKFLENIYRRYSGNVKLGLERIENILAEMDFPNRKLSGIHIAGTNGKGSTAAICEVISIHHGLKTGLNTSPHLVDYNERIRLNGKNISRQELMRLYNKWESVFLSNEASFFEITTAMAFYYFFLQKAENSIFEVGLGGRLDGTNPFIPNASVITTISKDHTKSLGDTIEKIAFEKAGIIKKKIPVIIGSMPEKAKKVIRERAGAQNSAVIEFGKDFSIENIQFDISGTSFDYISEHLTIRNLKTNLIGEHQAHNAALAISAFEVFCKMTDHKLQITDLRTALLNVNWMGRMQIIEKNPLVLIDGAHNEEGVKILVRTLQLLFSGQKFLFVLSILRDKNLSVIINKICTISRKIFIARNNSKRAAEIEHQVKFVQKSGIPYETAADVKSAFRKAKNEASDNDVIIISGSLYTISEILKKG